eukprot:scaffold2609_cov134-Pinguiococcus_pyrenoidosus.AAC.2
MSLPSPFARRPLLLLLLLLLLLTTPRDGGRHLPRIGPSGWTTRRRTWSFGSRMRRKWARARAGRKVQRDWKRF